MKTFIFVVAFTGAPIDMAYANPGHLGELAGHAHWVGLGAVIVAGAIGAALMVKARRKNKEQSAEKTQTAEETS